MESTRQLTQVFKQLLRLLKKENKALINNDGTQIEKIVKQKEQLIDSLSQIKRPLLDNELKLANEIKQLQDDNLLLTRQAMTFNNNFLQLVGESAKKVNATYSKKGSLSTQEDVSFVNHSM
ncbi:hypothetical protein [Vagococcus fluvialis]|uniref:hypothetical protein n=1 Tax=Vagococcus fluvialis TaxID=2738 RepID=UPI003B58E97B